MKSVVPTRYFGRSDSADAQDQRVAQWLQGIADVSAVVVLSKSEVSDRPAGECAVKRRDQGQTTKLSRTDTAGDSTKIPGDAAYDCRTTFFMKVSDEGQNNYSRRCR